MLPKALPKSHIPQKLLFLGKIFAILKIYHNFAIENTK